MVGVDGPDEGGEAGAEHGRCTDGVWTAGAVCTASTGAVGVSCG